jgi:hypothetical protein
MSTSSRDRARTLELIMRAAAAEERVLSRRLELVAEAQRRTRGDIAPEQRREHVGRPEESGGQ